MGDIGRGLMELESESRKGLIESKNWKGFEGVGKLVVSRGVLELGTRKWKEFYGIQTLVVGSVRIFINQPQWM